MLSFPPIDSLKLSGAVDDKDVLAVHSSHCLPVTCKNRVAMAATVDATSAPTAVQQAPYAWKVPKGGERSQNATCYWAGAWMAHEMKGMSTATLKPVPKSEIRDGSVPLVHAVTDALEENWEDVPHVAGRAPEVAHINHPKEGEVIGDSFTCHFVDPRTRANDQRIRLVFKPKSAAPAPPTSQHDASLPFVSYRCSETTIKDP